LTTEGTEESHWIHLHAFQFEVTHCACISSVSSVVKNALRILRVQLAQGGRREH